MSTLVILVIAGTPLHAFEDGRWVRISDGTLSVYTQGAPEQAVPLLRNFSELRVVLSETSGFHANESIPLKIIAFQSEKQFNQYRLNSGSCAFYQRKNGSEYIVLQDLDPGHKDVSTHEFTHFVLAHSGLNLPLWLNEGLADFYSTFEMSTGQVTVGLSVAGRLPVLRRYQWLPLNALFQVSTASSYYSDPEKMALFYSESWALTHMLLASHAYAPRFHDFLNALKEGYTGTDSLRMAYGKTAEQVQEELRSYVDRQHLPLTEFRLKSVHAFLAASRAAISDEEMNATLRDLISSNAANPSALAQRAQAVPPNGSETFRNPAAPACPSCASPLVDGGSAAAEESLGYLALKQGKTEEARSHFQLAADRQSDDPNVFFYLAHLDHEAGSTSSQVLPLLDRALALQPDLPDARLELALLAAGDRDFTRALAALEKLNKPRPENAFAAVYTKAYCYAHLDRLTQARATATLAQSMARDDHDRAQVSQLVDFIEQQAQFVTSGKL